MYLSGISSTMRIELLLVEISCNSFHLLDTHGSFHVTDIVYQENHSILPIFTI